MASVRTVAKKGSIDVGLADVATFANNRNQSTLRQAILAFCVVVIGISSMYASLAALKSLAVSDQMLAWEKEEDKKTEAERRPDRIGELAKIWGPANHSLHRNPAAMSSFAEAAVFDYRFRQIIANPPSGSWNQAWVNTSPLFLQIALANEMDRLRREKVVELVGGKPAMDMLEVASSWYARAHAKSPLDWRLAYGRCFTNLQCSQDEQIKLLPVVASLSRHSSQKLLSLSLIYQKKLNTTEVKALRIASMQAHPYSALSIGRLVASETPDADVSIDIFPQRSDILQRLATQIFTKDRFPQTFVLLWERAKKLVDTMPMTLAKRQLWLADASLAVEDASGEIGHLKDALRYEPSNIVTICRLANRLMDVGEITKANEYVQRVRLLDPTNAEVKALVERALKF
jgi:hypothetical protein